MTWDNPKTEDLAKALLKLKTLDETKRFLRDLLTEEEILEFGRRFEAANMLRNGLPYTRIVKETGLSSTTIARVSKWLNSGKGGYKLVLNRLNNHHAHTTPLPRSGLR